MSYIHIAIPVNLSSIQHHISLFHTYLDTFTSLHTTHSDKQQFARVISELATLAQNKLSKSSDRLRFLDHVLPEDQPEDPEYHSIHKRFVDGILLEVCKDTSHHVRVELKNCEEHLTFTNNGLTLCQAQLNHLTESSIPDYSYLSLKVPPTSSPRQGKQFWIDKLRTCKDRKLKSQYKLAECNKDTLIKNSTLANCLIKLENHNKNVFHKIKSDRIPFSNLTRTTTTTTPPPTTYQFYPFAPTRSPYHGTTTPPLFPVRHTRQIFAAVTFATGVLGTFLGLFNRREIDGIQNNLLTLTDQHNILTSVVRKHEHELATLNDQLQHLTNTVEALIMYNPALVYAILDDTIITIKDKITSLFNTLQQLQHQRLAVDLLDEHQMHVVWDSALNSAKKLEVQLLPTRPQDLYQLDASYIRKGVEVLILLHIPCIKSNNMLTLYEYVPFPYPLTYDPSHPTPSPGNLFSFQDLANSPFGFSDSALIFKSDFNLIAIGRNTNLATAAYKLVSQAELSSCIQKNHVYLCENQHTLRKDLQGSCLGALYLQHEQGVIENCKIDKIPLRETTYQLSSYDHLIFSPKPITTQILCKNGTHFPQKLSGTTQITVPPFCSIDLVNNTITSDGNTRITPDPLIFQWHLQPNLLPVHLLSATSHIDLLINELHANLSNFRATPNSSISDAQFASLLHSHVSTPSLSSAFIWSIVTTSLLTVLITLIFLFSMYRRRRIRRRLARPPFTQHHEPMSVVIPPAYESEDEISYIARTGHCKPSVPPTRNNRFQK